MLVGGIDTTTGKVDNAKITAGAINVLNGSDTLKKTAALLDTTVIFPVSTIINSVKKATVTAPTGDIRPEYVLVVHNDNATSDFDIKVYNKLAIGSGSNRAYLSGATVVKTPLTLIEDCEDAWNEQVVSNVTSGTEGTIKKVGTYSAKITPADGAVVGILASETISVANITDKEAIRCMVYTSIATASGNLQLLLDDTGNCASPLEALNLPATGVATWKLCFMPLTNPETDIALISVGLKQTVDLGACDIYIDDIQAVDRQTTLIYLHGCFAGGSSLEIDIKNLTAIDAVYPANIAVQLFEV